jgi:hypothetical protein
MKLVEALNRYREHCGDLRRPTSRQRSDPVRTAMQHHDSTAAYQAADGVRF